MSAENQVLDLKRTIRYVHGNVHGYRPRGTLNFRHAESLYRVDPTFRCSPYYSENLMCKLLTGSHMQLDENTPGYDFVYENIRVEVKGFSSNTGPPLRLSPIQERIADILVVYNAGNQAAMYYGQYIKARHCMVANVPALVHHTRYPQWRSVLKDSMA